MNFAGLFLSIFCLFGCQKQEKTLHFATCADYPPFEYYENGEIKGFDIDLAHAVAEILHKKAHFSNMQFSAIFPSLNNENVDAGISTVTMTKKRQEMFDFSDPYYIESLALVFLKTDPIAHPSRLKEVACQLGTTMQIWLETHTPEVRILPMDSNNQAIETLKAGHVRGVFMDSPQAKAFTKNNPALGYVFIAQSDAGYSIVLRKGSPLKDSINQALKQLKKNGKLDFLKKKWFKE